MSRDSESNSSKDLSKTVEDSKRRKESRKHKLKHEKKKHKKDKKRRRQNSKNRCHTYNREEKHLNLEVRQVETIDNALNAFGPALPLHLSRPRSIEKEISIIGPTMSDFSNKKNDSQEVVKLKTDSEKSQTDEDDDIGIFGPSPIDIRAKSMNAIQIELEERALSLKLASIDGANAANIDQKVREEWMLELPEVGLKSGLAALSNMKRTFHQGKERPDFSDRTSWTKTPQSKNIAPQEKPSTSKDLEKSAQVLYEYQRDQEQELLAKKHKKKHKRDQSLVEIHQKKLRKEQRKKERAMAASGTKPERRPFSRDVDLKLNKIDKNQTTQIVDKAKILNTKFSSGHMKYL